MKYIFFFFLLLFVSCSSDIEIPTSSETPSENFVDTYVDTLETSVLDARDITNTMNAEQEEFKQSLEGME